MSGAAFDSLTFANGPRNGEAIPVLTPTTIHAVLEFANGALVTLGASWDVWAHRHRETELYGATGSIYVPDPNFFGGDVEIVDSAGTVSRKDSETHPFGANNITDGGGNPARITAVPGLLIWRLPSSRTVRIVAMPSWHVM